jgi:diketogulonate reductase-like aldo/keto reductase
MTIPPVTPTFIYGTAWKEADTRRLVRVALDAGFRAIDTANQRRHYDEAGVGLGLADAFAAGIVDRDDLFLQTKFTHRAGQDARLPYDPAAAISEQVRQSFESSLQHLGTGRIDSYVLHGPSLRSGLHAADLEAWGAMEALHREGRIGILGVSNVNLGQVEALCSAAVVPPSFVQNRCFAETGWDRAVRAACRDRSIAYQGFSLLTANPHVVHHPGVGRIAARIGCGPEQVVFRFAMQVGMIPLTGTTDPEHMRADLAGANFELSLEDVALMEAIGERP